MMNMHNDWPVKIKLIALNLTYATKAINFKASFRMSEYLEIEYYRCSDVLTGILWRIF